MPLRHLSYLFQSLYLLFSVLLVFPAVVLCQPAVDCVSLKDCNACLNQSACGWCGNFGSPGICIPGTASGSNAQASGLSIPECQLAQWRKDACFSSRTTTIMSANNIEIIDFAQGPSGGKLQVIDAFMTAADATVPKNVGLWAVGVRLTGSGTLSPAGGQLSRDQIADMSATADVSAVGLLAVAEYFNPDGISPYQCPDWGVDRADDSQSCRTHFTRTTTSPPEVNFTPMFTADPNTGVNLTSIQTSSSPGSVTIRVFHPFAELSCVFYTTAKNPFTVSCRAEQFIFSPSSRQASLAFIFGGLKFSTQGTVRSFASLDAIVLDTMVAAAFKNQQTAVDQNFFQVRNDSNVILSTVNGPFGNTTVPYLFVNILNPNKAMHGKRALYKGDVKSNVLLTGPSVLIASPTKKKNRTPILVASIVIVVVLLILAAVVIAVFLKAPQLLPSFMQRKTEESAAQYSLHTS